MAESGLDRARSIVVIFLAGVAIIFAITVTTYLSAVIADKFCFGSKRLREAQELERQNRARQTEMTDLARPSKLEAQLTYRAGLSTISRVDRNRILSQFFEARSKLHKDLEKDIDAENDGDNAEGVEGGEGSENNATIPQGTDDEEESATASETPAGRVPYEDADGSADAEAQAEVSDEEAQKKDQNDDEEDDNEEEDEQNEATCSICLNGYVDDDKIMTGTSCNHIFHHSCAMQWLGKNHDHCAYCRKDMITPDEFRVEALEVLGQERFAQLETDHAKAVEEAARARAAGATVVALPEATDAAAGGAGNSEAEAAQEPDREIGATNEDIQTIPEETREEVEAENPTNNVETTEAAAETGAERDTDIESPPVQTGDANSESEAIECDNENIADAETPSSDASLEYQASSNKEDESVTTRDKKDLKDSGKITGLDE